MKELLRRLEGLAPVLEDVIGRLEDRVAELTEEAGDAELESGEASGTGPAEEALERHRSALGLLEDLSESLADVLDVLPASDLQV
jgi:hypothetical protein